jgi:hypothetical protein
MKKIYSVNLRSRFRYFWPIYIYLFLDIGFVFYASYTYGIQDLMLYSQIAVIMFLVVFIPTIYIHIEYLLTNLREELIVNDQDQLLEITSGKINKLISYDDIVLFEQFKTPPLIEKRQQWLPWASYNYVVISTKNKERIVITCFLVDELEIEIPEEKVKLKKVIYPNINRFNISDF